jgi:hypothetical protein
VYHNKATFDKERPAFSRVAAFTFAKLVSGTEQKKAKKPIAEQFRGTEQKKK